MTNKKWLGRAFGAALLAGSLGACDFIGGVTPTDPNTVASATVDQIFVSAQVNTFSFSEGQIARLAAMWTQQIAGTDRQFQILDQYVISEGSANGEFASVYTGGGLVDLNLAQQKADSAGCAACVGILNVYEAYLIGMTSSVFGAIPYREAANQQIAEPALDPMPQVYADVQKLLDTAIGQLQAGPGNSVGAKALYASMRNADLNYAANLGRYLALAHTLKARFYMHWVEAQLAGGASAAAANTACGGNCITKALAAAQNGINSAAGNFVAVHGTAATANNTWFQFLRDRSGYISAGAFLVDLLRTREDPRLTFYFSPATGKSVRGQFVGSPPGNPKGDPGSGAAQLNEAGFAAPDFNQPMVTCAENSFIIAETNYYLGNTAAAQSALQSGVKCNQQALGLAKSIPVDASLTGYPLLREIITQKYAALFLNMETFNDYKRTCLPQIETFGNQVIPRRLFYGSSERGSNRNIPSTSEQLKTPFNANDPSLVGTDRNGLTGVKCGGAS